MPTSHVAQVRGRRVRPEGSGRLDRGESLAGRSVPSIASLLGERAGCFVVDEGRDLVTRAVRLPCSGPAWVAGGVHPGVPAPEREVDATAERDRVVDDHELLVVHRSGGVGAVDLEMHSA